MKYLKEINEETLEALIKHKNDFGWVEFHIDTNGNYLVMPFKYVVDALESYTRETKGEQK